MIVKGEMPNVEVHLSAGKGDVLRVYPRKEDPNDIPLAICYSLGADFAHLTPQEQRARVLAMLKLMKVAVTDAVESIGSLIGAKVPKSPPPTKTGGDGGERGRAANIGRHPIESFWSMGHKRGGGPFVQGGLPGLGKRR